jgi:hypothetical protein
MSVRVVELASAAPSAVCSGDSGAIQYWRKLISPFRA